jgi:acyl-CoA synthetase (AMP-forming)/AMP-acid ligase II
LRPHSIVLVPELLRLLVAAAERGWPVPGSLKFVAVGGAAVSVDLLARAEAVGLPVFEGYGLSECASVVCLNTPDARRRGSVGRPLPHASVRLADDGQIMVRVRHARLSRDTPRRAGEEWATATWRDDADGYVYCADEPATFITSLPQRRPVGRARSQQPGVST